jgi:hypothetical protein
MISYDGKAQDLKFPENGAGDCGKYEHCTGWQN